MTATPPPPFPLPPGKATSRLLEANRQHSCLPRAPLGCSAHVEDLPQPARTPHPHSRKACLAVSLPPRSPQFRQCKV